MADMVSDLVNRLARGPEYQIAVLVNLTQCNMGFNGAVVDFLGTSLCAHHDQPIFCFPISGKRLIIPAANLFFKCKHTLCFPGSIKADDGGSFIIIDLHQTDCLLHGCLGFPYDKGQMVSHITGLFA